ncbi:MAG TPA: type 4a pilus biogenesis protein PilO [Candidatus Saccharimonadales bacterium]|nr:type 4a pilus biogenesis protein PilO [Candidatus Saccharimonadales bacterium]
MKKKRHLGLILLLAAIVGWFGLINGQVKAFSANTLDAKVANLEVASYNQRLSDLDAIRAQGSGVTATLTALFLAMPKAAQVPEVLVMVEGLGSSSGVTFNEVNVGTPDGSQVPVHLSFTGSQAAVSAFLSAVNKNIRTAVVKSQSVATDQSGNLNVTIQLGLVYQGVVNAK